MQSKDTPQTFSTEESYIYYWKHLCNYIACRIPHKEEAPDLTQDVFVKLLTCKQSIHFQTIKSFLFTITKNVIADHIRLYYRHEIFIEYLSQNERSSDNNTQKVLLANELSELVALELKLLPNRCREVYLLSLNENLGVKEIADRMHISYRTAERHLFVARKNMRSYLNQIWID